MNLQDATRQKMAAQLKEWNAQIDLMEAKAENAGASIKVKYAQEFQDLHAKQRVASAKLTELEKSSGEAWQQVKITADNIWEDLKIGVASAHDKFK